MQDTQDDGITSPPRCSQKSSGLQGKKQFTGTAG